MALRAGELDKKMALQTATETRNASGEPIKTWATHASRWARITYTNGGLESLSAGTDRTELRAVIEMRKDSVTAALTAKNRGVYSGKVFDFESVQNVGERNEEIRIEATVRG